MTPGMDDWFVSPAKPAPVGPLDDWFTSTPQQPQQSLLQRVQSGVANAPGIKQIGDVARTIGNVPVPQPVTNVLGVTPPGTPSGTPVGQQNVGQFLGNWAQSIPPVIPFPVAPAVQALQTQRKLPKPTIPLPHEDSAPVSVGSVKKGIVPISTGIRHSLPEPSGQDLAAIESLKAAIVDADLAVERYENLADQGIGRKSNLGRRTGVVRIGQVTANIRDNEYMAAQAKQIAQDYRQQLRELLQSQKSTGIVPPGVQAAKELIDKAKASVADLYGSVYRQIAPARAPGVKEKAVTILRGHAVGARDVAVVKSSNFWDGQVTPALRTFSRASNEGAKPETLRGAMSLYIDRLGNPEKFDAALSDALVKNPKLQPVIDRMNRMSDAEKHYAEQVIMHADNLRGQHLVDEDIISQAREFHVSHLWETTEGGQATALMGGGKLSPRTRFGQQRIYPTFTEGIAAGLTPRTLDIVAINKLNDIDTARAVMAKHIREAIATTGEGKWTMSREKIPADWVDLGAQLRIFRHNVPIQQADGTTRAIEQHFYVSREVNEGIKFLYERDPFKSPMGTTDTFLKKLIDYNAFAKQMELSFSFFHDFNLAKVFAFSRPLTALKGMVTTTERGPGLYQKWGPIAEGIKAINGMTPMLEKLIRSGLTISGKGEQIWDAYYNATGGVGKWGAPLLDNKLVKARNRALWETLQPGLKGADALITARDALKKFDGLLNPATKRLWTEDEIFESVAEVMNRKYGGLNWDRYGTTMGQRRILRALILAPDWTFSNLMLGKSALKGGFNITKPQTMFSNSVEGWAARQSLAKTTATFMVALQAVNMAMNDGKTTFQNPENRWYSIQLPWKTKDGRNLYADWMLPGELRDLIRVASAGTGAAYGYATNAQMPPQQGISGLASFAQGKISPVGRSLMTLGTQTKFGGQPVFQPGMTERDRINAMAGQMLTSGAPVPIGLSSLVSGQDKVQIAATMLGLGATSQGKLVPAQMWQSLPRANKMEFLDSLTPDTRDDFLNELGTGRITGESADRFRTYLDRLQYLRRQRLQQLPPEQRYLPPGGKRHLPPLSVTGQP